MRFRHASLLTLALVAAAPALAQAPTKPPPANTERPDSGGRSDPCAQGNATVGSGGSGNQIVSPNARKDQSLSDHLASSGGVICPPPGVDPDITRPAPEGGATPVIPPPGTPGGDQSVQPK
jgi:hypothetical protein